MSTDTREALAALMAIAAECAQRKPLRGFEELTEATHIGHRQFRRAHEQADEDVRMLAVRLRAVFDTLAAALATQPAQPSTLVERSDAEILVLADKLFPMWREDIQPQFVLRLARAVLADSRVPAAQPSAQGEAVAFDKWDGAEEWMPLAWELCADECGEEACTELVWEGGPVPEPWGDRWLKYEGEAKRLIALVRKHVPAAALASAPAAPAQPEPSALPVAHTSEQHFALREAHCIKAHDDYFAARPVEDGAMQRKAFDAGFARGFDAGEKVYYTAQPVAVPAGVRAFLEEVATQKPSKPDYWSSCGQCEHNQSKAEDLLAASPQPGHAGALTDEQIESVMNQCHDSDMARAYRREFLESFKRIYFRLHPERGIAPKAAQEKP